jgi:2,4-dienoyl-CoA reductase-like NADH-dependent reductase (Old Yellow Enzyme family)
MADDYQLVHLGRFALGGFGTVMVEATAVAEEGRISHGDLGLWHDRHIEPLTRIATFLRRHGAVPAIQLSHAGRKASTRRPWRGEGTVTEADEKELGDAPWTTVAPSALRQSSLHTTPLALDEPGIERIRQAFSTAVRRAVVAGFDIVELHFAHGYLLNQFLSPVANTRDDAFGGSRENRMRLALQIVEDARTSWPDDKPLFVRVSATDHVPWGWTIEDTVAFAIELKRRGVDVVDCSSGGFAEASLNALSDYHVPYADRVGRETGVLTMAAGRIESPERAEAVVAGEKVALVGIARAALADPNWPLKAAAVLARRPGPNSA